MRITLSFATTADGYLDDATDRRLMISTPEDWAAVLELRTRCDAILVGAETLRRDNPSLLLRDTQARERRRREGLRPDLTKVTLTRSGRLDPSLKFFTEGDAKRCKLSEFNSDNTRRLNLEETKSKIASLEYIQNELNGIMNIAK